ncbi:hypothetical protein ACG7TL_001351 [Trametes sanguinea]
MHDPIRPSAGSKSSIEAFDKDVPSVDAATFHPVAFSRRRSWANTALLNSGLTVASSEYGVSVGNVQKVEYRRSVTPRDVVDDDRTFVTHALVVLGAAVVAERRPADASHLRASTITLDELLAMRAARPAHAAAQTQRCVVRGVRAQVRVVQEDEGQV